MELVDTPGLSRTHEGNAARLAMIREAGCLVIVVAAFDRSDPLADLARLADDLLLADLAIVAGRVERLRESVKKPRPSRAGGNGRIGGPRTAWSASWNRASRWSKTGSPMNSCARPAASGCSPQSRD